MKRPSLIFLVLLCLSFLMSAPQTKAQSDSGIKEFTLTPKDKIFITLYIPSNGGLNFSLIANMSVDFAIVYSNITMMSVHTNSLSGRYPYENGGAREGNYIMVIYNPDSSEHATVQLTYLVRSWHLNDAWFGTLQYEPPFWVLILSFIMNLLSTVGIIAKLWYQILGELRKRIFVPSNLPDYGNLNPPKPFI